MMIRSSAPNTEHAMRANEYASQSCRRTSSSPTARSSSGKQHIHIPRPRTGQAPYCSHQAVCSQDKEKAAANQNKQPRPAKNNWERKIRQEREPRVVGKNTPLKRLFVKKKKQDV